MIISSYTPHRVPLPPPTVVAAQGVLGFAFPSIDPERDERFIRAANPAFPHVVNRVMRTAELATQNPHLVLASTSSQLAVSALQADFQVRFYGEYPSDVPRCIEYVRNKLEVVLAACVESEIRVAAIGVIVTVHFPATDSWSPVDLLRRVHLRSGVDHEALQDIVLRMAFSLRDTYFLNITLSNYESRVLERPIVPGFAAIAVRPWEGRVTETGLEMILDMNNVLEARTRQSDPEITSVALDAIANTLQYVATAAGPRFAESGELSLRDVLRASEPVAS